MNTRSYKKKITLMGDGLPRVWSKVCYIALCRFSRAQSVGRPRGGIMTSSPQRQCCALADYKTRILTVFSIYGEFFLTSYNSVFVALIKSNRVKTSSSTFTKNKGKQVSKYFENGKGISTLLQVKSVLN